MDADLTPSSVVREAGRAVERSQAHKFVEFPAVREDKTSDVTFCIVSYDKNIRLTCSPAGPNSKCRTQLGANYLCDKQFISHDNNYTEVPAKRVDWLTSGAQRH